jgi:hypothetical protein
MNKSWIIKIIRNKLYEFHLKIIFLPNKEVDEEKEWAQIIILKDFHIKNLKIVNLNSNPQRKEKGYDNNYLTF